MSSIEHNTKLKMQMASKAPKEPFVMYLGVLVALSALHPIMSLTSVNALLEKYQALKRKDEVHITLKFFPRTCSKEEKKAVVDDFRRFMEEHGNDVCVTITGIGYHEGTCALQISSDIITRNGNSTSVPWTHAKQNHITIALEEGKKAQDSVNAVIKQEDGGYLGDFVPISPTIINGHLQTFSS